MQGCRATARAGIGSHEASSFWVELYLRQKKKFIQVEMEKNIFGSGVISVAKKIFFKKIFFILIIVSEN